MGVSHAVFYFIGFYVFFLIFLSALSYYGLNSLIANSVTNVIPPTPTTLPIGTDVFTAVFNSISWFFQNIVFLFTLIITNPFSSFTLISYFFTFMTIMFIVSLIMVIRG